MRLLNLIDEHTRESFVRAKVFRHFLRHHQWAEVRRQRPTEWLAKTGAKTLYIEPGSPWENGYCESFNTKLRDEFFNGEIFY